MKKFLEYKGYYGELGRCEDSEGYRGKVLGIKNGLILYEGETVEELEIDFKNGIEDYLDCCERHGIEPEKPSPPKELANNSINIRLPIETKNKIAAIAKSSGISINAFIRDSIEKRLEAMVLN